MNKEQEIYRDLVLQTTNVLFTLTNLIIRREQLVRKSPKKEEVIAELDQMIENLECVRKAEEIKTLQIKVLKRQVFNRDKEIRELKHDLKKQKEMNEHLLVGI